MDRPRLSSSPNCDEFIRDGMAAHYILLELERTGYAKVLAMVADSSNTYSAAAKAAVNKTCGRANIPLGAYQGGVSSGSSVLGVVAADHRPIRNPGDAGATTQMP